MVNNDFFLEGLERKRRRIIWLRRKEDSYKMAHKSCGIKQRSWIYAEERKHSKHKLKPTANHLPNYKLFILTKLLTNFLVWNSSPTQIICFKGKQAARAKASRVLYAPTTLNHTSTKQPFCSAQPQQSLAKRPLTLTDTYPIGQVGIWSSQSLFYKLNLASGFLPEKPWLLGDLKTEQFSKEASPKKLNDLPNEADPERRKFIKEFDHSDWEWQRQLWDFAFGACFAIKVYLLGLANKNSWAEIIVFTQICHLYFHNDEHLNRQIGKWQASY